MRDGKISSDQWGKAEMLTPNKQGKPVQLQRLSEETPLRGDATV